MNVHQQRPVRCIRFGQYTLLQHLRSEGNYIEVFRATQAALDREVEIRILKMLGNNALLTRFLEEVKILSRIDHPGVIPVLDQGMVGPAAYFTTTMKDCVRLEQHLGSLPSGRLDPETTLRFAEVLSDAVSRLHRESIIHRAISSTTVFYDSARDLPFIGECSVMKSVLDQSLSAKGLPALSRQVTTPEVFSGEVVSERTDVFLLCSLFYEMLSGSPPLPRDLDEFRALVGADRRYPPIKDLAELLGDSSLAVRGLSEITMRGLSVRQQDRFSSAVELADTLAGLAKRHAIRLVVRRSARRSSSTRPLPPAGKVPRTSEKTAEGLMSRLSTALRSNSAKPPLMIAAFTVSALLLYRIPGDPAPLVPNSAQPRAALRNFTSKQACEALLDLESELSSKPTSEKDFLERLEILRSFFTSGMHRMPFSYSDLIRLRYRFITLGDKRSCAELDGYITAAAGTIKKPEE